MKSGYKLEINLKGGIFVKNKDSEKTPHPRKKTRRNKQNILYFEYISMRKLYKSMKDWQQVNRKRFLSLCVQRDGKKFCCIALTNPSEVVITDVDDDYYATVIEDGRLMTHSW